MPGNPSNFKGDNLPVETVNWYDFVEYCNIRSVKEGLKPYYNIDKKKKDPDNVNNIDDIKWTITINAGADGYRLPAEVEWEYAASGDKRSKSYTYSGSDNIDKVAWYWKNSGVRGRSSEVEMKIEKIEEGKYRVNCSGGQVVESKKATKRNRACFDADKCADCPLADKCPTVKQKKGRVYYFSDEDYKKNARNRKINELPVERRKIRNNVEATMKEFTKGFNHKGKLNIRGYFKTAIYAIATAIGINFGRIHRYQINYET